MTAKADARWDGFHIVLTSIGLGVFSTATAGIAIAETTLTVNILAATTLSLSLVTLIHSLVDIFLYKKSHLNPVYAISLYSIIFTFWLIQTSWELVEVIYISNGAYYDYYAGMFGCSIGDTQFYLFSDGFDVKCPLPKGRFGVSWFILILYVAEIIFAAQVLKKDQKRKWVRLIDERILAYGKGGVGRFTGDGSMYEESVREPVAPDQNATDSPAHGAV
ncbi:hypothetical protein C7212DRAFT_332197 [Tuber magnatum]|uniref:MARVEL domain-containing protein n=1 Tax=Tuber magnatum TaxID=42249 RepID=A0A317SGG6_9PEZI|nr:hypothetical protein C7212DRAFT_332197 [Tuber magnatum]